MGLDMFLHRTGKVVCPHCGKEIKNIDGREEVAYWRKANAIHKWFSDHCADGEIENCEDYYVTEEQLVDLRNTCEKVLNSSKLVWKTVKERVYDFDKKDYVEKDTYANVLEDPSLAEELLPTQSGYFFGGIMYDEGYVEDLKSTIEQINKVLTETDFSRYEIIYHAWW